MHSGNCKKILEARTGIEPAHKGFADLSLTTWVPRPDISTVACSVREIQRSLRSGLHAKVAEDRDCSGDLEAFGGGLLVEHAGEHFDPPLARALHDRTAASSSRDLQLASVIFVGTGGCQALFDERLHDANHRGRLDLLDFRQLLQRFAASKN